MPSPDDSEYDLAPSATPVSPRQPSRPRPAPAPAPAPLLAERDCPRCRFHIAAPPPIHRCPRCHVQLDATAPDILQFSNPSWVAKLHWAALLMALVGPLHIAASFLGHFVDRRLGAPFHIAAAFVLLIATWIITLREPDRPALPHPLARWARWLTLAAFLAWTVASLERFRDTMPPTYWIALYLSFLLTAAESAVIALYLKSLAFRIPNDDLVNSFQNIAWGLPALNFFFIFCKIVDLQGWFSLGFFVGIPLIVGLALLVLWVSFRLLQLSSNLRATLHTGPATPTPRRTNAPSPHLS